MNLDKDFLKNLKGVNLSLRLNPTLIKSGPILSLEPIMRLIASLSTITLTLLAAPAYAYIDPGVGSVMVQALLAGGAGVFMVVRLFWRRLTAKFGVARQDQEGKHATEQ